MTQIEQGDSPEMQIVIDATYTAGDKGVSVLELRRLFHPHLTAVAVGVILQAWADRRGSCLQFSYGKAFYDSRQ